MSYIEQLHLTEANKSKLADVATVLNHFSEFRNVDSELVAKFLSTFNSDALLGTKFTYDDKIKFNFILEWISPSKIASFILENYKQSFIFQQSFKINRSTGCYAPYMALNFAQNGSVGVCCYTSRGRDSRNDGGYLGSYPESSIKEIWTGKRMQRLRSSLDFFGFKISDACFSCIKRIQRGDSANSLLTKFDNKLNFMFEKFRRSVDPRKQLGDTDPSTNITNFYRSKTYPLLLEFELSNICNYECIMCGGDYSSMVRKNVEKRPPLISPYDSKFVEQLEEFIPHAEGFDFLGGEPFLVPVYYEIWDKIIKLNPAATVNITTNGSILNDKVKEIFNKIPNLNITVSLDSVNPDTYAFIRRNGKLQKVLDNIEFFINNSRKVGISVCPMIQNIYEMHDIVQFCINKKLNLYFNEVVGTLKTNNKNEHYNLPEVALSTVTSEEKEKIIKYLCSKSYATVSPAHHVAFNGLVENIINS